MPQDSISLSPAAVALRAFRIWPKNDKLVLYEAITFPRDPRAGCELYLRRASAFGFLSHAKIENLGLDILDQQGDILDTFSISPPGFSYLRRCLRFRIEQPD